LELVATHEEIDVSGGTPLERREGLRAAIESIEAGQAEVLMVAYFDRLVRSLAVQGEVVSRVEVAGGRVVALDVGDVSGATAALWLQGTMLGAVAEYQRRMVKERAGAAQRMAVARGVAPYPQVPPGYSRGPDGVLVPNEDAEAVRTAFLLRAEGETIAVIREFLRENGIERSYHGVQAMLASRTYLGEIHFGTLVNLNAHEPIVDRDLWQAVQRVKVTRGRRAKSDRLLARLGILRCGTCGSRMVVGTQQWRNYAFYRCPPVGDCPRRMTIAAHIAESVTVEAVKEAMAGIEESVAADQNAQAAEREAERAQVELDAAVRAFSGFEDEGSVRERLAALRGARDRAVDEARHLSGLRSALTIGAGDWERLTMKEQRALIQAVVESVTVRPGKGAERLSVTLR
jgi:DNA invertase Pin-like site-specific DNA recombinase